MREPSKYRSRIRIIADILTVIRDHGGRVRPTKIMYLANLSYERLQRYLSDMLSMGLIEEEKAGYEGDREIVYYKLTDKGLKFLLEVERFRAFAEAFGLEL
ncbi:MAG: winged helix-turn-helix domain-containing protein [Candidatus Nezhaarchaeales archaeon]